MVYLPSTTLLELRANHKADFLKPANQTNGWLVQGKVSFRTQSGSIAFWHLMGTSQCNLLSLLPSGGDDTDRRGKLKAKQEIEIAAKGLESIRED